MQSVYPRNLMAPRRRTSRMIKGAVFFTAIVTVTAALFVVSIPLKPHAKESFMVCKINQGLEKCKFQRR